MIFPPHVFESLIVDHFEGATVQCTMAHGNHEMTQDALDVLQRETERHLVDYFRDVQRVQERFGDEKSQRKFSTERFGRVLRGMTTPRKNSVRNSKSLRIFSEFSDRFQEASKTSEISVDVTMSDLIIPKNIEFFRNDDPKYFEIGYFL